MSKVYVIYWSQTGNTLAMANAIGAGIEEAGAQADVLEVGSANIGDIKDAAGFALGCPAMGAEELEDSEMEPFVSEVEKIAAGKTIALFGSYGWGDGEWMRTWADRMKAAGANVIGGESAICQEMPEDADLKICRELGSSLAKL